MKKIIALMACLWALAAGATNITNYPVRTTFNANYWFLLSDVPMQTNWNLPGNYVASTADLNNASNSILQQFTNTINLTSNVLYTLGTNLTAVAAGTNVTVVTNGHLYTISVDFSSLSNSILTQFTNTINSTSNSILTQFTNTINTTSNSVLTEVTNSILTVSNNIISQVATNRQIYYTNACAAPDFSKDYGWTNVSASFTAPLPINVPAGDQAPTFAWHVENSGGSPIQVSVNPSIDIVLGSVMWVTGRTTFTFHIYGRQFTNVYGVPNK